MISVLGLLLVLTGMEAGRVPSLPARGRTQYSYILSDGGHKYGFDTNERFYARQEGQKNNEVQGAFAFKDAENKDVNVEYTSGVRGFVPRGHFAENQNLPKYNWEAEQTPGNPAYNFAFSGDNQVRSESADSSGSVRGSYSYQDEAGTHELTYTSGTDGFKVIGGSLAKPYSGHSGAYQSRWKTEKNTVESANVKASLPSADGSYGFDYSAGDHSRQESTDAEGNVIGSYSFVDKEGRHEVRYKAGPGIGYLILSETLNGVAVTREAPKPAQEGLRAHQSVSAGGSFGSSGSQTRFQESPSSQGSSFQSSSSQTSSFGSPASQSSFQGSSFSSFGSSSSAALKNQESSQFSSGSLRATGDAAALKIFNVDFKEGELTQYQPTLDNPKFGYTYEAKS